MAMIEAGHIQSRLPEFPQRGNAERLADGLGWFSIGLGAAEVLAPDTMTQLAGISDGSYRRNLMRLFGLREIATGIGILTRRQPAGMVWGRVAGDLMDLATLGAFMGTKKSDRTRAAVAASVVLGVTALDIYCGQMLARTPDNSIVRLHKTIIVDRSPEELYAFWKEYENFPRFVDHLESIRKITGNQSHWVVRAPGEMRVEWDAEVEYQADNTIAWHTLEGSDVHSSGKVRFAKAVGGRGTLVRVDLEYAAPGAKLGAKFAKLFGMEPGQLVEHALRRMKQILETGDIVRSDSSIHYGPHPALPPAGRRRQPLPQVAAPPAWPQARPA